MRGWWLCECGDVSVGWWGFCKMYGHFWKGKKKKINGGVKRKMGGVNSNCQSYGMAFSYFEVLFPDDPTRFYYLMRVTGFLLYDYYIIILQMQETRMESLTTYLRGPSLLPLGPSTCW